MIIATSFVVPSRCRISARVPMMAWPLSINSATRSWSGSPSLAKSPLHGTVRGRLRFYGIRGDVRTGPFVSQPCCLRRPPIPGRLAGIYLLAVVYPKIDLRERFRAEGCRACSARRRWQPVWWAIQASNNPMSSSAATLSLSSTNPSPLASNTRLHAYSSTPRGTTTSLGSRATKALRRNGRWHALRAAAPPSPGDELFTPEQADRAAAGRAG